MSDFVMLDNKLIKCNSTASKVVVPNNIEEIYIGAFMGNTNVETVVLPNTVTYIGSKAFAGCTNLRHINIPDGAKAHPYAFNGCGSIRSKDGFFIINDTLYCFNGPDGRVRIPEGVRTIAEGAFQAVSGRRWDIIIARTVTNIFQNTFRRNYNIRSIEYLCPITAIDENAFNGCKMLETVKLPDTVTEIGNNAFSGCERLTRIKLPDSLEIIGHGAFSRSGLTEINLPKHSAVVSNAFEFCNNLEIITRTDCKSEVVVDGTGEFDDYIKFTAPADFDETWLGYYFRIENFYADDIDLIADKYKKPATEDFIRHKHPDADDVISPQDLAYLSYISENLHEFIDMVVENPYVIELLLKSKLIKRDHINELIERIDSINEIEIRIRLTDYAVNELQDDVDDDDLKGMLGIE